MRLAAVILALLLSVVSADAAWLIGQTNSASGLLVIITSPAVTTPITGSVNLQASCPAAFACTSVAWSVDGMPVGSGSGSPYTLAFNTAVYADGQHVISAVGTSSRGAAVPANPVTIITSNSISNKTVYISGAGNDGNNCLTTGTACATLNKANSFTYYGGDTIALDHANPITVNNPTVSTELTIVGPSNTLATQNLFGMGKVLTITSYNGSGSCNPIAGVTSNCATINITGTTAAAQTGIINLVNSSFVTVQNIRGIATSNSVAANSNILYGVNAGSATNIKNRNVVVQNCEIEDVAIGIYDSNTLGQFYATSGTRSGTTVQNCWLHGSTITSKMAWGYYNEGVTFALAQNNLVENIGTDPSYSSVAGIHLTNGADNVTVQFNVIRYVGANNTKCGGPYGFETAGVFGPITVQFNEAYNNGPYPSFVSGCDMGNYDLDMGTSGLMFQYNYGHDSWGNGLLMYTSKDNSNRPWQNNTVRFNIWEHDATTTAGGTTSGGASVIAIGTGGAGTAGTVNIYNNTIWDNAQGVSNKNNYPIAFSTCLASPSFVANNIFAATQNPGFSSTATVVANFALQTCTAITWKANDWYSITAGKTPIWTQWGGTNPSTLAQWQGVAGGGDTGATEANPLVTNGGGGGTCYSSGIPAGPQPCPSAYVLQSGSTLLGAGIDLRQAPYNQVIPVDYYGNPCWSGGVVFNIGADGCRSLGIAPVVTATNCTVSSGFTNGQTVNQTRGLGACTFAATCNGVACSGVNAITVWAISAQSNPSAYSLSSGGVLQGGPNAANVTNETDTVTVTATNSTGTSLSKVQTVTAYADGSIGAPASCLSGASYQNSSLLNGYTTRPPWNVAGVDYCVGVPSTVTLVDPFSTFPSALVAALVADGCGYNGSGLIACGGVNGVTISGYDFSLHGGMNLQMQSTTGSTVSNNKFAGQAFNSNSPIQTTNSAVNLTIKNNYLDGTTYDTSHNTSTQGMIDGNAAGNVTIEYNAIVSGWAECIRLGSVTTSGFNWTMEFNAIHNCGAGEVPTGGAIHGDQEQSLAGTGFVINSLATNFNMFLQDIAASQGVSANGTPSGTGSQWQAESVSYNVQITLGSPGNTNSFNNFDYSWLNGRMTMVNNYIDRTGMSPQAAWWDPVNGSGPYGSIWTATISGNIDLLTGSTLTPSPPTGNSVFAPVVQSKTCTISSPVSNASNVVQTLGAGTCTYSALCNGSACGGGNAITSWAITSQSSASAYSITSAGVLQGGSNAANVGTEIDTVTVTATNSTGTSPGVTQTINAYADGSVNGSGGTAQFPTLLNGYAKRPPWNVPGVDYAVGYGSTSLADPWPGYPTAGTGALASALVTQAGGSSCIATGTNQIQIGCSSANIHGWNFGLHNGIQLYVTGNNATVQNNNLVGGSNNVQPLVGAGTNITLLNNVINGSAIAGNPYKTCATMLAGNLTAEYNYIENCWSIALQHALSSGTATHLVKWNIIANPGMGFTIDGSHGDIDQTFGIAGSCCAVFTSIIEDFNLLLINNANAAGQGFSLITAAGNRQTYSDSTDASYNTAVYGGTKANNAYGMAIIDTTWLNGTGQLQNNYMDPTGMQFGWSFVGQYNGGKGPTNAPTASGNNTLHFASSPCSGCIAGQTVYDVTTPSAIPAGTTITTNSGTSLVMSANATGSGVGSGDQIVLGDGPYSGTVTTTGNINMLTGAGCGPPGGAC